jgi:outer membrane protein insertion porin family
MKVQRHHRLLIPVICFLTACSTTKHLPEGEKLYTGAEVKLNADGLTAREQKVHRSDLQGLTRPKPNTRLLGIPIKLGFYNLFRKAKPNSFFGRLRNQLGEPPVLLSTVDLDANQKILQSHLENKGFFRAQVAADTSVKGKKAKAIYTANAGSQYHINSVVFVQDSGVLTTTIQQGAPNSLLKVNEPFDLDVIKGERTRIDAYLKERGFYFFSPEYLLVRTDTTGGGHKVDMQVVVKPETPDNAREQYHINNVYIYSNYRLNAPADDTSKANAKFFEGYNVIDKRNIFKPKMFAQAMQFSPGDIYNRTDHNLTLSRLINLNEFRFVRNRFEPVPDSAKLDAYYYLTPMQRKSLRAEVLATNKSNNLNGSQISVGWTHRNIFKAGEHLSITAYAGSEIQFGGNFKGYNVYRSGAEANLVIPRFFIPFTDIRTRGGYVPRTNLRIGYDILNRRKLYTLNSYRFGFGYTWRESVQKSHEFFPISINYVQPLNVTKEYRDSIAKYPYLENIIDSQFIIGTTYQYNYNDQAGGQQKINSFYFNGLIDLSGNLAGMITGANKSGGGKRILNALFDQYIKLEADGRFYRRIGLSSTWANRVIVGYGLPYGNSRMMPYVKQFFSGGNNSIRAFRSRSLLGAYSFPDTTGFLPDQTGDLKLEFNTEFRPHISGPLYGAIFIDAGNTWLKNEDPSRPGAQFTKDFMKQLAIGAGVGLRVDIQIFVIRLDVAFPVRKPWEDNPWVLNQIRLNQGAWRKQNIIYNLAIGYPF